MPGFRFKYSAPKHNAEKTLCCLAAAAALLFLSSWPSAERETKKPRSGDYGEQISIGQDSAKNELAVPEQTMTDPADSVKEQEQSHDTAEQDESASPVTEPEITGFPVPAVTEPEVTGFTVPAMTEPEVTVFTVPAVMEYTEGVTAGSIRYVSQLNDVDSNGWGKYSWKAGMECTTACISMALSYLGIDASPEAILDYSSRTVLRSCYGLDEQIGFSPLTATSFSGAEERFQIFQAMFEAYTLSAAADADADTDAIMSPVLLYIAGSGNHHALLVIGQEDDVYLTVDPTPAGIHRIRIAEDGTITAAEDGYLDRYTSGGTGSASIESLAQWYTELRSYDY